MSIQPQKNNPTTWKERFWGQLLQKYYLRIFNVSQMVADLLVVFFSIIGGFALYRFQFPSAGENSEEYIHLAVAGILAGFIVFERVGLYRYQPSGPCG